MSQPDVEEFRRFIDLLMDSAPEGYEPWLFRCEKQGKAPAVEFGSWKSEENLLTVEEAVGWLEEGGNIGIAGMPDDRLVNVDIDDDDATDPDDVKPTLMARSRSRSGRHFWFFEADGEKIPNIPTEEKGEIRARGQYVLAPGSYVETDPDLVPEDQRDYAGYYTVERERPVNTITRDELPDVFLRELRKTQQQDESNIEDYDLPEVSGSSAVFEVTARDVAAKEGASTDPSDRWESAFHGSTTGSNMSLSNEGRIQCWRHNVAHGGFQALVALSDYPSGCAAVGTGHKNSNAGPSCVRGDDSAVWHAWKFAKENGYIPQDDPIPYRAIKHICVDHDVCPVTALPKDYDPENGETIPAHAWDTALSIVQNHYELKPGREKTEQFVEAAADGAGVAAESVQDTEGPEVPEYESVSDRVQEEVIVPLNPEKYGRGDEVREITSPEAVDIFAGILDNEYSFVRPREDTRGWRDTLYVYSERDGIYEPHGESWIETEAERLLGQWATNHRVKEIVSKVERRNRLNKRQLEPEPNRLVVQNGILDLETGELDDHDPSEYHRTMVPVDWNPDTDCSYIDEFMHDVVEDGDVDTLYRFIAHCLYKEYRAEKAAMLLGDGENGKSTFLSLVKQFLGGWNVSNQSLIDLNMEDFAAQNLVGKLCNIHPDLSNQSVKTLQMFKKLTGRDAIDADVKFENPVTFENYATLIFACNRMPALHDDTRGNWRRWVLIEFPYTFERDDEDYVEKSDLMDRLTADEQLEGLLVRCVEEIKRATETGRWFPDVPGWRETRKQIMRASEPVYDFAEVCLEESADEDAYVIKSQVREAYRAYAAEEGLPTMSREKFGQKLLNETDLAIESSQKRVDGHRRRVYEGVQFTSRGNQLVYGLDGGEDEKSPNAKLKEAGGPRKRADKVYDKLCEITDKGEAIEEAKLAGALLDSGLSDKQIRQAIGRLIDKSRVSRGDGDKLEAMR